MGKKVLNNEHKVDKKEQVLYPDLFPNIVFKFV